MTPDKNNGNMLTEDVFGKQSECNFLFEIVMNQAIRKIQIILGLTATMYISTT